MGPSVAVFLAYSGVDMKRSPSLNGIGLSLSAEIYIAGVRCSLHTNSPKVISALSAGRHESAHLHDGTFEMDILEDSTLPADAPHDPRFRGMHHLLFADFGRGDTFGFDLLRRKVIATISSETAANGALWDSMLLPIVVGVLGAAVGVVPVHSACLDWDHKGLMIVGASGAGKSTLCVTLSQRGLSIVSEGWTYITEGRGGLMAHGISPRVKLLPDAVRHFPELQGLSPSKTLNGEIAFDIDAADVFHSQMRPQSTPRWLLFLQRVERPGCEFVPLSPTAARTFFENGGERLPPQLSETAARRSEIIEALSERPSWLMRYGCGPQQAANEICGFVGR